MSYKVEGSFTLDDFGQAGSPQSNTLGPWQPIVGTPEIPGSYEWQRFRMIGSDTGLTRGFFRAVATQQ